MERLLISNKVGKPRTEVLHGREFIVAPATIVVQGVLNGSKGALYYPDDEISKDVEAWNGMPVVIHHPFAEGEAISARSPSVLNDQEIGRVFNAETTTNSDGLTSLKVETWIDPTLAGKSKLGRHILNQIKAGKPVELSTGLFTENHPAPKGATFNGIAYDYIARNYKPDHLAILPDQVGACSVNDGCGLLVNQFFEDIAMAMNATRRTQIVKWLTTNCSCFKGNGESLNKLPEGKLLKLAELYDVPKPTTNAPAEGDPDAELQGMLKWIMSGPDAIKKKVAAAITKIVSGGEESAKPEATPTETNADEAPSVEEEEAEGEVVEEEIEPAANEEVPEEEEETMNKEKKAVPTKNNKAKAKKLTANEWLASAPSEVQSVVKAAIEVEKEAKIGFITKLVANVRDQKQKKIMAANLASKPLDELKMLFNLLPQQSGAKAKPQPTANYFGSSIGIADVSNEDEGLEEPIPSVTINWAEKTDKADVA